MSPSTHNSTETPKQAPDTATPAVRRLSDHLRELALKRGPEAKMPTVRELCAQLSTSKPTLDGALALLERQNVIYRRQGSGIYVSPHLHRRKILLVLDSYYFEEANVSPFWSLLWGLCMREANRRAQSLNEIYEFRIVSSRKDSECVVAGLRRDVEISAFSGIIAIGMNTPNNFPEDIISLPMISFAGPGMWQVQIDQDRHWDKIIGYLASAGCRRIGYWQATEASNWPFNRHHIEKHGRRRRQMLQDCLGRHSIAYDETLIYDDFRGLEEGVTGIGVGEDGRDQSHQEQGYELVMRMFSRDSAPHPDGIYIDDDMLTAGALVAFEQLGLRPGTDVHICTNINVGTPTLFRRTDAMALVEVNPQEIAYSLFVLLDRFFEGSTDATRLLNIVPEFRLPAEK